MIINKTAVLYCTRLFHRVENIFPFTCVPLAITIAGSASEDTAYTVASETHTRTRAKTDGGARPSGCSAASHAMDAPRAGTNVSDTRERDLISRLSIPRPKKTNISLTNLFLVLFFLT